MPCPPRGAAQTGVRPTHCSLHGRQGWSGHQQMRKSPLLLGCLPSPTQATASGDSLLPTSAQHGQAPHASVHKGTARLRCPPVPSPGHRVAAQSGGTGVPTHGSRVPPGTCAGPWPGPFYFCPTSLSPRHQLSIPAPIKGSETLPELSQSHRRVTGCGLRHGLPGKAHWKAGKDRPRGQRGSHLRPTQP